MKVALYLENRNLNTVDCSRPEKGNPGIGGTHYNIITLPYYFQKLLPDSGIKPVLLANSTDHLPDRLESRKAENINEAARICEDEKFDILIWRPTQSAEDISFSREIDRYSFSVVNWVFNTPTDLFYLRRLARSKNLKRFVCVSQEQADRLRDHVLSRKAVCILSGIDAAPYKIERKLDDNVKNVLYVGSLVPAKGFHLLAQAWPRVLGKVPKARLYVIGSGQLYNRNARMGKWNIAEEGYEKKYIRPYLSDDEGNIHSSVNFLGVLGNEKLDYFKIADVGVVNPSAKTENCPGSAQEFQAAGIPVVSYAKYGLLDTVADGKTGILGKRKSQLAKNVVYLLEHDAVAQSYGSKGIEYIEEKFNHMKLCGEWLALFNEVIENKAVKVEKIKQFPYHDLKFLREFLRLFKQYIPIFRFIPAIIEYKLFLMYLKRKLFN